MNLTTRFFQEEAEADYAEAVFTARQVELDNIADWQATQQAAQYEQEVQFAMWLDSEARQHGWFYTCDIPDLAECQRIDSMEA